MTKNNINEVKKNIENCLGQEVILRGSLGRNKTFEKFGKLEQIHPHNFLVITDKGEKCSYTYENILTKSVEFSIENKGKFDSILDVINEQNAEALEREKNSTVINPTSPINPIINPSDILGFKNSFI